MNAASTVLDNTLSFLLCKGLNLCSIGCFQSRNGVCVIEYVVIANVVIE